MIKKSENRFPTIKQLVTGCFVAVLFLLAGSWILATVTVRSSINSEMLRYMITLIIVVSSSVGTAITNSGRKKDIFKTSIAFTVTLWLILIAMNALLLDGSYQGIGFTLLLLLGGSLSMSLITVQLKNKQHRIKGYKKNR